MKWYFLRGLIRETRHWSPFLKLFQERFPSAELVALDLPGCGKHHLEKCPLTVPEITDFLRRKYPLPQAPHSYFLSVSLGAMVGIDWLTRYPDDFQGAILMNTSLRNFSSFYERLLPKNYIALLKLFLTQDILTRERMILQITANREEVRESTANSWVQIQRESPVSRSNAIRQILAASRFKPPSAPSNPNVLLLRGQGDHLVSPRCTEAISLNYNWPLQSHPSAGHDLSLDEPEWVLSQVENFLLEKRVHEKGNK